MTTSIFEVSVAEAKARLSELLARVARGERFIVTKRGSAAAALVPVDQAVPPSRRPLGLAAFAGALADWDDLPGAVDEIYRKRRHARDRDVPDMQ